MSEAALKEAGIALTTIRIAVGNEDPRSLLAHIIRTTELAFDSVIPNFSKQFMPPAEIDRMHDEIYLDVHRRYLESRSKMAELLS
jgi:hypothetical protein